MNGMIDLNIDVILLHSLILFIFHLLYLVTKRLMKEEQLFQDRVQIKNRSYILYILIIAWAALLLDFVHFPAESRLETVIKLMECTYIPICIYLCREVLKSHKQFSKKSKQYYEASITDSLTKLPNRNVFYDRLTQLLRQAREQKTLIAVMYLDLDQFKTINDEYGHQYGDRVLMIVAERLQGCVRSFDTVSRFGGDEFTVIAPNIKHLEDAELIAKRFMASISEPIEVEDYRFLLSVSIGICFFPGDGDVPDILVNKADSALYQAKKLGKNNYQFFNPEPR